MDLRTDGKTRKASKRANHPLRQNTPPLPASALTIQGVLSCPSETTPDRLVKQRSTAEQENQDAPARSKQRNKMRNKRHRTQPIQAVPFTRSMRTRKLRTRIRTRVHKARRCKAKRGRIGPHRQKRFTKRGGTEPNEAELVHTKKIFAHAFTKRAGTEPNEAELIHMNRNVSQSEPLQSQTRLN